MDEEPGRGLLLGGKEDAVGASIEGQSDAEVDPDGLPLGMPFTDEQVQAIVTWVHAKGKHRAQIHEDFQEVDFLAGAMMPFFACQSHGMIPAGWIFGLMAGTSPLGLEHRPEPPAPRARRPDARAELELAAAELPAPHTRRSDACEDVELAAAELVEVIEALSLAEMEGWFHNHSPPAYLKLVHLLVARGALKLDELSPALAQALAIDRQRRGRGAARGERSDDRGS
jgi:hypothetical protein